ncbi:MAG: selenocysteine-specific translation elongation factor [Syntrophales bacterium]|jgi:selenocysteine-specific elongation factor|nr:selenocysteine-specific translation elongation factor [Syntrophales bacterium]
MKHIVMGTAGHVDHGKTALIKRLTGVDTDRLKEEKERGITIELGFASLVLPGGQTVGIVDVPGHERFVKNMVAGAAGIDLVAMVIAADEGVMPQTREHMHICSLLGIRKGVVVVTKIDMVDRDWLELVQEDIRSFLMGTFLEGMPVVPVSSFTGEGIPALLDVIEKSVEEIQETQDIGILRLPVDRVFSMKGFGTVITGTLISGSVTIGEDVEFFPVGFRAKVRGIQVHNEPVKTAEAGQRTAVNLQGTDREEIERGSILANVGSLQASQRLDCAYNHLKSAGKKIMNRTIVRLHVGTSEIMARFVLYDRDFLEPGEEGYVQFVLENPLAAVAGDRFVVRSYSPVTTIGGGVIVDPLPAKHKKTDTGIISDFEILAGDDEIRKIEVIARRAGIEGIASGALVVRAGIPAKRLAKILEGMFADRKVILVDRDELRVLSAVVYEELKEWIVSRIADYHRQYPLREALAREELRSTPGIGAAAGPKIFLIALHDLEKKGKIVVEREMIRLTEHEVRLDVDMGSLRESLSSAYRKGGLTPPTAREIAAMFPDRKKEVASLELLMLREGEIARISEDLNFHRDVLAKLREDYKKMLVRDGEATPASVRELTGLSRKFIIPLMEYFDSTKLTMRAGDKRILRERTET